MGRLLLDTITLKGTPLTDKIRYAREAGYDGLELRGNDLDEWVAGGQTLSELRALMDEVTLVAPAICTEADLWGWHLDVDEPKFTTALHRFCEASLALGCRVLVFPVMSAAGDLAKTTACYDALCQRLAQYDLVAGLEFIGHIPKVPDIGTAWRIVKAVDHPNAGIVCDLFHFHRGGSRLEDLQQIPGHRLAIVHIDDAMALPREQLVGSKHRLYAGEGVVPLDEILRLMGDQGYTGDYAVEIFNEEYWAADPAQVAKRSLSTAQDVLRRREV